MGRSEKEDQILQTICEEVENSYLMGGLSDSDLYSNYAKDVSIRYLNKKIEDITQEMINKECSDNSYDYPSCGAYESGFQDAIEWVKSKLKQEDYL